MIRFFVQNAGWLLINKLVTLDPRLRFSKNMAANVNKLFVRRLEDDPILKLSFVYSDEIIKERRFTLNRLKDDHLGSAFARIQSNIQNVTDRKTKRKHKKPRPNQDVNIESGQVPELLPVDSATSEADNVAVSLQIGGNPVLETTKNIDAWVEGAILTIGDFNYEVSINFPAVTQLSLPKSIMAGFPIHPKIKTEFADDNQTVFTWFRRVFKDELSKIEASTVFKTNAEYWQKIEEGYFYVSTNDDIGKQIKVVCVPKNNDRMGVQSEAISPNPIEAGPGLCPFEERHLYTEMASPLGSFRCVTYNILADLYADSKFSRETLFPYCPEYALDIEYRKQLLLKEIIGYKGDLICLQEVDRKVFLDDLQPLLKNTGLEGIFNVKGGQVVEGLATFYRNNKFRLLENEVIILSERLPTDPVLSIFYETLCKNEKLKERVLARTTAMQIALLESVEDPKRLLLVGNVHLYFHPDADHIRLFQASVCLRLLEDKLEKQISAKPGQNCALILTGDFNSCPEFGVYKFMTTGKIDENEEDWKSNPNEVVSGLEVSHNLNLGSACGCPQYTNYTVGFQGCLDYIYFDQSRLSVTEVVPMTSHEDVIQGIALPNALFPSDHLALVCTLKWNN